MSKSTTHRTLLIVLIVIVVSGGLTVVMLAGGGLLAGVTEHDLGVLHQQNGRATGHHTFVLTNSSERPLTIRGVKTSCGCSSAGPDVDRVEPGDDVRIDASLTIDGSMMKRVRLTVDLGEDGLVFLYLEGTSQRANPLHVKRDVVELIDGEATLNVYLEVYDSDDTPDPAVASADPTPGVEVALTPWTRGRRVNIAEGKPAVWSARATVTATIPEVPADAAVTITQPGYETLVIPVVSGLQTDASTPGAIIEDGPPEAIREAESDGS